MILEYNTVLHVPLHILPLLFTLLTISSPTFNFKACHESNESMRDHVLFWNVEFQIIRCFSLSFTYYKKAMQCCTPTPTSSLAHQKHETRILTGTKGRVSTAIQKVMTMFTNQPEVKNVIFVNCAIQLSTAIT